MPCYCSSCNALFFLFCSFSWYFLNWVYYLKKQIKQVKILKITLLNEPKLSKHGYKWRHKSCQHLAPLFEQLSHCRVYKVVCTLVGTYGLSMNVMEAMLAQLPPSIISSHTLPPLVHRLWKICFLYLGLRRTSLSCFQYFSNIWSDQNVFLFFVLLFTSL